MKKGMSCIFIMMIISSLYSQDNEKIRQLQNFKEKYPGMISVQWDKVSGGPKRIFGNNIYLKSNSVNKTNLPALTNDFINENEDFLNIRNTECDFENITQLGKKYIVIYQQVYSKIPLWNVKLKLKVADNGQLLMIKSPCFNNPTISVQPSITMDVAKNNAAMSFNIDINEIQDGELLIYPEKETGKLYLCWHIKLEHEIDKGLMIDAQTGQTIYEYDLCRNAEVRGTVRTTTWKLPGNGNGSTPPDTTPYCRDLKINITDVGSVNTNSSGNYSITVPSSGNYMISASLDGPYCYVTNDPGCGPSASYSNTASTSTDHNWTWQPQGGGIPDIWFYNQYFVFHYMNNAWNEFNDKVSGFSSNYWYTNKMRGIANYGTGVNGSANGTLIGITEENHYGGSVYHEYSHNVIYQANGYFLGDNKYGDGRAIDEGLADYYSCSFRNDPIRYASNRRLDTKIKYYPPGPPNDDTHESHTRGQIVGGACWDLSHKSDMSLNYVNALVYEAIVNMGFEETFGDFMDEILSADDNDGNIFNGTPHDDQICDAFVNDHAIIGSFVAGNLTITSDFIVECGATLTISPGTILSFDNGSSLIVRNYGMLTASGNLSTPITFDFGSSNASTQNGIKFNSGSSGTINYCKIRKAYRGIYENGVSINITNSAFSNCYNGLYLYNTSPDIQCCDFHDNVYAGIYLIYSSPYLFNNKMRFNYYGTYSITGSNPKFGNGSTQGENGITDNYCGVYCWNNAYPVLGRSSPLDGGYNNLVNAAYNVYNSSSGTVYANHIWWGATTPSNFKIYGSGTTSYTDYLSSSVTISPAPPLSKSSSILVASADNNIPMLSELEKAYQLIASNDLAEARDVCLNLIHNYPDYSVSFNALNLLKETYTNDEIKSEEEIYKTLFNSKEKKDIHAMAGLILSSIDEDNRLNRINEVINRYEGESIVELALFDKFVHYYFGLDDEENALAISKELDEQFPLSQGAFEAHRILGDEEYYTIKPIIKKGDESPTVVTIMEFSLSDNYPNPFNPTTKIKYTVPEMCSVTLKVYDILGKEIVTLVNEEKPAGSYEVEFNGSHLASGVYFYHIQAGSFSNTRKFILMK